MIFPDKIFGQIEITEPVILELINLPQMQRLKKIHQYGIYHLFYPEADTTRFEHSLGVYWLLKYFKADLSEQAAGLMHDISHSAFSHVIDHFYDSYNDESHQDSIHSRFFKDKGISTVLKKYRLDTDKISDLGQWKLLDAPLPDICADRLQYTLADAMTIGKIDAPIARLFLDGLIVQNGHFIFKNKDLAKEFAALSLWMSINFWHTNFGAFSYNLMKNILQYSLENKVLTETDLFTDDESIEQKLDSAVDAKLKGMWLKLKKFQKEKVVEDIENYDFVKKTTKMRVVDPLVKIGDKLVRVTELFPDFKTKFEAERQRVLTTKYLRYLE